MSTVFPYVSLLFCVVRYCLGRMLQILISATGKGLSFLQSFLSSLEPEAKNVGTVEMKEVVARWWKMVKEMEPRSRNDLPAEDLIDDLYKLTTIYCTSCYILFAPEVCVPSPLWWLRPLSNSEIIFRGWVQVASALLLLIFLLLFLDANGSFYAYIQMNDHIKYYLYIRAYMYKIV